MTLHFHSKEKIIMTLPTRVLLAAALLFAPPAWAWKVDKNGVTQMKLTDDGNVVLGVATPIASEKLAVPLNTNQGVRIGNWMSDGSVALFVTPVATTQGGFFVRGLSGQSQDIFRAETHDGAKQLVFKANGDVGIGTTAPAAKLDVAGQVKITGGSPGAGKVLTSDANGLASWQVASGGGGAGRVVGGWCQGNWGSGTWMGCSSGTRRYTDSQQSCWLCIE